MVFKLYLHFEGPPQHSKVFKIAEESDTTVSDILLGFADAYNRRSNNGSVITAENLALVTERKAAVDPQAPVVRSFPSGSDLNVILAPASDSVSSLPRQLQGALAGTSKPPSSLKPAGVEHTGRPSISRPKSSAPPPSDPALVKPFLEKAADAESKQHYRIAATIYQQVLNRCPQKHEGLVGLIRLWLKVSRPAKALPLAEDAVKHNPEDAHLHELYAESLQRTGSKDDAMREYDAAACLASEQKDTKLLNRIQVSMAALLYSMGGRYKDVAASIVMSILESDEGYPGALFQYAVIAQDQALIEDATRVLLRLLVLDQEDAKVKLHLAQCLQQPEGMQLVKSELDGSKGRPAALAFLATAVKDHGAIPTCIQLFQMAVKASPQSPSYALNLMHAYELEQNYGAAISVAINFCKTNRLRFGGTFDPQQAAAVLEGLPTLTKGIGTEWLHLEPWWLKCDHYPTESDRQCAAAAEQQSVTLGGDSTISNTPGETAAESSEQVEYRADELDALALLFTAVKVLYLGGAIARTAQVVDLIEPARKASRKALHTTLIRNEAAYFSCIAQLLTEHPPPPPPAHLKPLYLCGDSHTLSGAWHTLLLRGEQRLITPLLVTGCKIWHLRKAGRFYPKMAWISTLNSLPDASQLIFMFGEIDCREGLLLAVDKLKYETMEDAMCVLTEIYAHVLLTLVEQRKFEIFVHPVPSVLNETRHVVRPFNLALQKKVRQVAQLPEAGGRLHWLDLFDKLLTPDGLRMKPSLHFDGTHMNPGYVKIIEDALPGSLKSTDDVLT